MGFDNPSYPQNYPQKNFYNKSRLKIKLPKVLHTGFNILFTGNLGYAQSMETIINAAIRLKGHKDIKLLL